MPKLSELMAAQQPVRVKLSDLQGAEPAGVVTAGPITDATPSPEAAQAASRAAALVDLGATMPALGGAAQLGDALRGYVKSHASPDSTMARVADSVLQNGVDAVAALGHHVGNIPLGLAQLATHGAAAVAPGLAGDAAKSLDAYAKTREATYQAGIPTNVGSVTGATVGELAPWVAGMGALRAAGAIPQATSLAGKLGTLAAEGGAMGAAQPVTGDGSYAGQKAAQVGIGAVTGPLLYGAGKLAGGVKGVVQHVANPQAVADANIAKLFGATPQNITALRGATQYVPGESPSAAQVLATPEAVQAERMLRTNAASAPTFVHADNANNAARMDIVNRLAGDDTAMAAAKDARRIAVQPFTSASLTDSRPIARWTPARNIFGNTLDNAGRISSSDFDALKQAQRVAADVRSGKLQEDDALQQLQDLGDSVTSKKAQDAFARASAAINKNMVDPSGVMNTLATLRNGPMGVDPERGAALDAIMGSVSRAKNINGLVGTDMLDQVRQQAAKYLGNASDQSKLAYGPATRQIVDAIEQVAPGYRDYLAAYAKHSEPVNTMESVQKLVDPNAPGSLNAAGDPQLTATRVKQLLRGDDKARYPMSDDARAQLDKVLQSLQRRGISDNKIGPSGSNTAADLSVQAGLPAMIFGKSLNSTGGPLMRMTASGVGGIFGPFGAALGSRVGDILSDAAAASNQRILGRIGSTAADAGQTADALARYLQLQQRQPSQLERLLLGTPVQTLPAPVAAGVVGRP